MRKSILMIFVAMLIVSAISLVSAGPVCATVETTYVGGIITDQTNGNVPVAGASVVVDCNGNVKNAVSDINGGYSVEYTAAECSNGSNVSVSATYDSLSGSSETVSWYSEDTTVGCLKLIINVACVDVPLVPEFGVIIGGLTVASAIVLFFVVRRK